ncbi:restriction endonuclease subunit S [Acidithiobacillus sp. MC6.1]|nr:restriction endonuclease subunit S [Acidithiobacillus sp. MC6.1]
MSSEKEHGAAVTEKQKGLVPRLRFPEFWDAGEWEESKLGFIGTFTGGGTPSKDEASYWVGKNPWISSSDISDDNIQDICISRFISDNAIQETATKIVPANSILLVSRVGVGKLAITKVPICTSQDFTNFTPRKDDLVFLAYYLKTLRNTFLSLNQGMAIKGFTKDDVSGLEIFLPRLKEQQKIADCLSSLDDLITAEAKKLDALKVHKKGLMQQLFPREGETVPRLRFPEFRDAGEWHRKTIGSVCNVFSGGTPSTARKKFYGGIIPFIRSAEIDEEQTELFLSQEGLQASAAKLVSTGDVLVALYGANSGEVAISKIDGAINQAILCLKSNNNHYFIYQHLSLLKEWIVRTYIQGGQGNLSGEIVKSIPLGFPEALEQQKIADCLSSLDDLITAEAKKLDALKAHKKGLMQQLFPVPDTIAG